MRVVHIIPSAFEYFDDIRAAAFGLVEELRKTGVEAEPFTIEYGAPGKTQAKKIEEKVKATAPSRKWGGLINFKEVVKHFENFDVVHIHCPMLGAFSKIIAWKKLHPKAPLLVTYYRTVTIEDAVSVGIRLYNNYYLPRLFKLADLVAVFKIGELSTPLLIEAAKAIEVKLDSQFLGEDISRDENGRELLQGERLALKYCILYNILCAEDQKGEGSAL